MPVEGHKRKRDHDLPIIFTAPPGRGVSFTRCLDEAPGSIEDLSALVRLKMNIGEPDSIRLQYQFDDSDYSGYLSLVKTLRRGIKINVLEDKSSQAPDSKPLTIAATPLSISAPFSCYNNMPHISSYKRKKYSVSCDKAGSSTPTPSPAPAPVPSILTNPPSTSSCASAGSPSEPLDTNAALDPVVSAPPASALHQPPTSLISLAVDTSIEDMTLGWSAAEVEEGRRLVRFTVMHCAEEGTHKVHVSIANADQSDTSAENTLTVSCIARPSGIYAITSVDLLRLATLLYGRNTTKNEEGSLRRRLERLEPVTVGKRTDLDGIFDRIAKFSDPRPLSIVKDVKLFDWARLKTAMDIVTTKQGYTSLIAYCALGLTHGAQMSSGATHGLPPEPNLSTSIESKQQSKKSTTAMAASSPAEPVKSTSGTLSAGPPLLKLSRKIAKDSVLLHPKPQDSTTLTQDSHSSAESLIGTKRQPPQAVCAQGSHVVHPTPIEPRDLQVKTVMALQHIDACDRCKRKNSGHCIVQAGKTVHASAGCWPCSVMSRMCNFDGKDQQHEVEWIPWNIKWSLLTLGGSLKDPTWPMVKANDSSDHP